MILHFDNGLLPAILGSTRGSSNKGLSHFEIMVTIG